MNIPIIIQPFLPNFLQRFFSTPSTQKTSTEPIVPSAPANNLEEACDVYAWHHSNDPVTGKNINKHDWIIIPFIKSPQDCERVSERFPNDPLLGRLRFNRTEMRTVLSDILIFGRPLKRDYLPKNPE